MIFFIVPSIPVAQPRQSHRVINTGKAQFVQNFVPVKHPVQAFKASVQQSIAAAYSGAPLDGPIFLRLVFVMPRPKGMCWKSKPTPRCRHIGRPDLDNLAKSVKDALKGIAWRDDSQVCSGKWSKWIAAGDEQPHVEVEICRLECVA